MSRLDVVSQIYNNARQEITSSEIKWKEFLRVAGNNHKYSFNEQLLIYAQKPTATACASFELWTQKLNCRISRGAKGIALFDSNNKLKYVFDVSDVYATEDRTVPKRWELGAHTDNVVTHLENIYGNNNKDNTFVEHILDFSNRIVDGCYKSISDKITNNNYDIGKLNELDKLNIEIRLKETLANSIAYCVLKRCDIPQAILDDEIRFNYIDFFDGYDAVFELGENVSSISKSILIEIEKEIKNVQKTLAKDSNLRYNALKHESAQEAISQKHESQERVANNDADTISTTRGLFISNDRDGQTTSGRVDEIRISEEEIPRERAQGLVNGENGTVQPQGTSADGAGESREDGRTTYPADAHRAEYDRVGENQSSDVGGETQSDNRPSGTDSASRTNQYDGALWQETQSDTTTTRDGEPGGSVKELLLVNENKLSQRETADVLSRVGTDEQVSGAPDEYRDESSINGRGTDGADGETRGSDRGTQEERPNEMGRSYEQHQTQGNRDSSPRDNLHLIEKAEDSSSAFLYSQPRELEQVTFQDISIGEELFFTGDSEDLAEVEDYLLGEGYSVKLQKDGLSVIVDATDISDIKETLNAYDVKYKEEKTQEHGEKTTSSFDFKTHEVTEVGKKERFRRNIEAIKVLKECELDNRLATASEQEILANYVGWGGIPEAFDENNLSWTKEYLELHELLDSDEYAAARASTLTAFYTPKPIINAVYNVLEQMNFKGGNVLEPSCGIGHFIGMLPDSMQNSKIYGVELDKTSAEIAKQLYQNSNIENNGFEKAMLPDNFFDVVVGNVPFGDFKVVDKKYDKHNFLIHDYFFAKSLDKLRPGGVMALITSKGTMDKENSYFRKYLAQRADLLGAIRLPNNAFKGNAGTEVVSDILFLQKREHLSTAEPDWVNLSQDENGISMNSYFVNHSEMILGEMKMVSGRFGPEVSCVPIENANLTEQLEKAVLNISGEIREYVSQSTENENETIPADLSVRNFSFTVSDDKIYYRENSVMTLVTFKNKKESEIIKALIPVRDALRKVIEVQKENYPDEYVKKEQDKLNELYDTFVKKYGYITSNSVSRAFKTDSSFPLLKSLELLDENGNVSGKADIFTKRTIKAHIAVTSVDTASEALAVSIAEKGCIDIEYMSKLSKKEEPKLYEELKGVIFLNPMFGYGNTSETKYVMADEYLSGNVRAKLAIAKKTAELYPEEYDVNVEALNAVQPKDLSASEISARLGSTWIPPKYIQEFIYEFLDTPSYARWNIKVGFSQHTAQWHIDGKNYDVGNIKANSTYGTQRINAYRIIEETLNLKDVRIYDYVEEADGKRRQVLNKKETAIAVAKQESIKQGFADWIWKDVERREHLTRLYNEKFNCIRPREYDGSHITFSGINPEITLREHQKNAIAHILYGGNTLLAHTVGAGKTFEMVAAAMESKRLGLCTKSMFVVPNHLTEQWASEFLQLYPSANILVATKKDFEKQNRKNFCGKIATGEYDAVIIGHSQFEKIPMSRARQRELLNQQLDEIVDGIADLKANGGRENNFSVKQLEKSKKAVEVKLEKLNDQSNKDDVVTFEELGVDKLFVDESHYYKNLYLYTKMRNVSGIAQTEAQKSSDLFMKCRYLDEITGGRGIVFATGTPISNSMVELYSTQRYLQYETLAKNGLQHFDAWASTFGENITSIELSPEGTGYRAKTKFAKFYNLPELMSMFREVADIKTADMLNLPVPKANFHNVSVPASEIQKEIVESLGERADKVRNGNVDAYIDNMLKITNDGRKLALDQRMINEDLPDFENSKVNACVNNIFKIWERGIGERTTQLVFCDLSIPKGEETFSVYNDIRNKLVELGVPTEEIEFIHNADTEKKKAVLFDKVNVGDVRILIGSTEKMGAGTNVQRKLVALHDLDCPWRPSDLEQRLGRIVRQGNTNSEVDIFRYVTEQTFDAYSYQLIEGKQKFISQIMTSKSPVRSCEDVDETALSYAEIKMLATGDPRIKEKMDLDISLQKLRLLKSNFLTEKYALEDKINKQYPQDIVRFKSNISAIKLDLEQLQPKSIGDSWIGMTIANIKYADKAKAGEALLNMFEFIKAREPIYIGEYRGFKMELSYDAFFNEYELKLKNNFTHSVELGKDAIGNITRIDNAIDKIKDKLIENEQRLEYTEKQLETAKIDVKKEFPHEEELKTKTARANELNAQLNLDEKDTVVLEGESEAINDEQTDIVENHQNNEIIYLDKGIESCD